MYKYGVDPGSFRWNGWNVDHVSKHGVEPDDAEEVVLAARAPFPSYEGDGKWLVRGQTSSGTYIQVIYVVDSDGRFYIIHARQLTHSEKRRLRRRLR